MIIYVIQRANAPARSIKTNGFIRGKQTGGVPKGRKLEAVQGNRARKNLTTAG